MTTLQHTLLTSPKPNHMQFNSYIEQERNYDVQGYVFLGARNTVNENQFVLFFLSSCDAHV